MGFLRTVSTSRLLGVLAATVVIAAGGTAIAVAATSGGPVPKRESLARAVHGALSSRAVTGITARISFTNSLIASSNLGEQADPLLTGASGRLWLSTDHQLLRLELQGDNGDAEVVVKGGSFWIYDPTSNTVYKGQLPAAVAGAKTARTHATKKSDAIPSIAKIQREINALGKQLHLSGATPGDVAGQPTYTVRASPLHGGGLLGATAIAFDAVRGVPLQFSVYAKGSSSPVLKLSATNISFGQVAASAFAVSPPSGAKVVQLTAPSASSAKAAHGKRRDAAVSGVAAVAKSLPFTLVSPAKLDGLKRASVRTVDWSGSPAALLTYGQGLGGIAVIEQPAKPGAGGAGQGGGHSALSLPTVSINGASGQELPTALGTMITFTRSGVSYTVLGSVTPAAARAAARGL